MTDEAWIRGWTELAATLPDKDQEPVVLGVRGQVYRRELGKLTDQSWLYAVSEAVRNERWFPTVACLLDYANDAPETRDAAMLKAYVPTDQDRDKAKEAARRGVEMCREAFERVTGEKAPPIKSMPKVVTLTDQRRAELEKHKAEILRIGGKP